jgi:hypothetical protein
MTVTLPESVTCACGATTIYALARCGAAGAVTSCWIALDDEGRARPGCVPDERTGDVAERRNARLDEVIWPRPARVTYVGGTVMRCACGRTTRVITSNFSTLPEPRTVADPPDPAAPVGPTACWLATSPDGGPEAGCTPDERTWDVLARARGFVRPGHDIVLEEVERTATIPDEARAAFKDALVHRTADPAPETPSPAEDKPLLLSLFG